MCGCVPCGLAWSHGPIAQLAERTADNREVSGSNPLRPTTVTARGCSSVGRAPPLQGGGRRFDPGQLHQARATWRRDTSGGPLPLRQGRPVVPRTAGVKNPGSLTTEDVGNLVAKASTKPLQRFVQCKRRGQATKGVRWMPWRRPAMKDVVSCDKLR